MKKNPYAPDFDDLPEALPVFPLGGVLLLPFGDLPLNIFEPRYIEMVDHAMATNRLIGMVQPQETGKDNPPVYKVGCAGKIVDFAETTDGRYLITLGGICRFDVEEELSVTTLYRQVRPNWSVYKEDLLVRDCLKLDRDKLTAMLSDYFEAQDLSCDWERIREASDNKLITCLSMICPFDASEKQALLEAPCCQARAKTFMTMLEMALHDCPDCAH